MVKSKIEKRNMDLRKFMADHNITQWQLAELCDCCEQTIIRWLRIELPEEKKQEIMQVILDHEKAGDL